MCFEVRERTTFRFFPFVQNCYAYFQLFCRCHMNFRIIFSVFEKIISGILIRIALILLLTLSNKDFFTFNNTNFHNGMLPEFLISAFLFFPIFVALSPSECLTSVKLFYNSQLWVSNIYVLSSLKSQHNDLGMVRHDLNSEVLVTFLLKARAEGNCK